MALQTAIGTALISVHGYAAPQTAAAYGRVRELCQQFGDAAALHATLSGEFVYHFVRGDYAMMRQLTKEARLTATRTADEAFELAGHRMGGITAMYAGCFAEAVGEFERSCVFITPTDTVRLPELKEHLEDLTTAFVEEGLTKPEAEARAPLCEAWKRGRPGSSDERP